MCVICGWEIMSSMLFIRTKLTFYCWETTFWQKKIEWLIFNVRSLFKQTYITYNWKLQKFFLEDSLPYCLLYTIVRELKSLFLKFLIKYKTVIHARFSDKVMSCCDKVRSKVPKVQRWEHKKLRPEATWVNFGA